MNPQQYQSVRALLTRGLPHREIARRAHVDRETVAKIAAGQPVRLDHAGPERPTLGRRHPRDVKRCPTCGRRLDTFPCLACAIEAQAQTRRDLRALENAR
jgi:hypothetical protein